MTSTEAPAASAAARGRAEVLRISDAVEDDDERVVVERERAEVPLPELTRAGVVAQPRDDALVIARETVELGAVRLTDVDPGSGGRIHDRPQPLRSADAGGDQDVPHASSADGLDDRPPSTHGRRSVIGASRGRGSRRRHRRARGPPDGSP